jgi:succinate dehydrogenase / fumarate reductase flavoprotein subunit
MGGLWVDYNLMTTIPGLYAIGEANFSDHGANRLGASALMQGVADGYFVLPYTISDYLAQAKLDPVAEDHVEVRGTLEGVEARTARLLALDGTRTVNSFHKEIGRIVWDECGMGRNAAGLERALETIPALRQEFWENARVVGDGESINQTLERAGRVADFLELAEVMCLDALVREESCGGHFREEHQTPDGEAKRDDENFMHVTVWEYTGPDGAPREHRESLEFEYVPPTQRSYK